MTRDSRQDGHNFVSKNFITSTDCKLTRYNKSRFVYSTRERDSQLTTTGQNLDNDLALLGVLVVDIDDFKRLALFPLKGGLVSLGMVGHFVV